MGRVALVTGANQGLGFALAKGLCAELGSQDVVYLTARSVARGEEALAKLGTTTAQARFERLDVSDEVSVAGLARTVGARHGGIDIVISNAAARSPDEAARDVLWLALLPPGTGSPRGELVQCRRVLPWT